MRRPLRDSADNGGRRRRIVRGSVVTALTVASLLGAAGPASAHERWFTDDHHATDWSFAARPLALGSLAAVVLVTLGWRWLAARYRSPELPVLRPLGRLVPFLPRLLAVHLGIALLALAARGEFLSPALSLDDVPAGPLFAVLEGAVGAWLISGVHVRHAAYVVIAFGPALFVGAGAVALLENAALLGIAVFLALVPPAHDAAYGRVEVAADRLAAALLALRVGAATSLVSLAFSEKFTNPAMARALLDAHPELQVFSLVGVSVDPDVFIVVAGAVEVLFGLLVLSGAAPQVAVLVAAVPFNASLLLFGATELVGHLPVYGVLLTLLAYGSAPATARLVPLLRLDRRSTSGRPAARTARRRQVARA